MSNLLNNVVAWTRGTNDPPADGSPHPASSLTPAQDLLRRETEITIDNFDQRRRQWVYEFDGLLEASDDEKRATYRAAQAALGDQIPKLDKLMTKTSDLRREHTKTNNELQAAEEWLRDESGEIIFLATH